MAATAQSPKSRGTTAVILDKPIFAGVTDHRALEIVETDADARATGQRRLRIVNSTWLDHYLVHQHLDKDPQTNQILFDVGDWYREQSYRAGLNPFKSASMAEVRVDGGQAEDHDHQHVARQEIRAADRALLKACPERGPFWKSAVYYVCVEDYSAREWAKCRAGYRRINSGLKTLSMALRALAEHRGLLKKRVDQRVRKQLPSTHLRDVSSTDLEMIP